MVSWPGTEVRIHLPPAGSHQRTARLLEQRRVRTVARTRSGGFLLMGSPAFAERRGRPTQRNGIGPVIWRGLFDTSPETVRSFAASSACR